MKCNDRLQAKALWKALLIIILIVAVAAVIVVKQYTRSGIRSETSTANPLERALKTGRPVVADFGRGKCIPCKAMKPILDELTVAYKGKAEVLIFDIDEYSELTEQYRVQLIPTQIFFDKSGREAWRHEGFLEKEKIIAKLSELGVN